MKLLLVFMIAGLSVAGVVQPELQRQISLAAPGELIPIVVHVHGALDTDWIESASIGMTRSERQQFVVNALKANAQLSQQAVLASVSDEMVEQLTPFWLVNGFYCHTTPDVILKLSMRSDVRYIERGDVRGHLIEPVDSRDPAPGERAVAWGVTKINAPQVWDMGYEGQGVIVGVIDTGVDYNHPDLHSNMWHDTDAGYHYGYNFYSGNPLDPMDDYGHGTHCAGTVAGMGTQGTETGVAPSATIMALRINYYFGGEATWVQAMEFGAENGAAVLSMSLGSYTGVAFLREAEEALQLAGVIHSVAAGNSGPGSGTILGSGDCPPPWFHPNQTYHGGNSAVVTVGATDSNDTMAGFSSRGPVTWWGSVAPWFDYSAANPLISPDVSAPGVDVYSTQLGGGYTYMSGTSMATPHVAGVMALMLSANPELTVAQIDSIIEMTALDLGAGVKNNTYGAGRIDAYQAVLAALQLTGLEGDSQPGAPVPAVVLSAVSPNPVSGSASFSIYSPEAGDARIVLFDVAGRAVARVHEGNLDSGNHSFMWSLPENRGTGIYFVRAFTPAGTAVSRMTVVR